MRNNADALVNATQQTLDELGDKVPADAKAQAEEAIAETKTALEGTDIDAIKAATEKIQQAGYKLAMAMRRHNPDPKDEESVLDEKGKVDPKRLNAFVFDTFQSGYYAIGEKVGQAWKSGMDFMK